MGEQRRQYTREFKIEAVRLVEESGRSKAQIARELGVHESLLERWKAQLERRPAPAASCARGGAPPSWPGSAARIGPAGWRAGPAQDHPQVRSA